MEFVNLYGCTTAEKLIKLTEAVNDLHSVVNELGLFVYDGAYNNDDPNFQYNAELLHTPTVTTEVLNRPVYFSENTTIAVITTYGNNLFTVRNAHNITGAQGVQGERGEKGEKGERGEQGIQGEKGETGAQGAKGLTGTGVANITNGSPYVSGEYTVTPVDYEMSDGTEIPLSVYAKNGADGGVTVDDALSTESINPVQNKVVTVAINNAKPIIDSQLSLSSENAVQNKVVAEAINAAANTPKLYYHYITFTLRIGTQTVYNFTVMCVDTNGETYTFDDFKSKYRNTKIIHRAYYDGYITHPGTNNALAISGIELVDDELKIFYIETLNTSRPALQSQCGNFYTPENVYDFDDTVTEI